jgi:hypothetical protein
MTKLYAFHNIRFSVALKLFFPLLFSMCLIPFLSQAQEMAHDHPEEVQAEGVEEHVPAKEFNMENMIFNHINNSNEFHLWSCFDSTPMYFIFKGRWINLFYEFQNGSWT